MLNISKPTKATIDQWVTNTANDLKKIFLRCDSLYHYLASMTDGDLTALGYGTDDIYAIRAFGVAIENLYLRYGNQTPLDSGNPSQFVENLLQPLIY